MISKVLVANRSEIAVRIIRACHELGIPTVAVYSEADRDALHVELADESICIGKAASKESYLRKEAILSAAIATGADAIHPGFGFLSENADFVEQVEACGITFIGPTKEHISCMGDKSNARETMIKAGVPVVPGTTSPLRSTQEAHAYALEIGFPVMVKAAAGGGGKGMRLVFKEETFDELYEQAQMEARLAFSNDTMYLEKYIESPRHIEVQVFGDGKGGALHLFERDCTLQRNHQKVIEEAPATYLTPKARDTLIEASLRAVESIHYRGAGTMEFLVDKDQNVYFIEMNTRIQVEHPITEMITGVDIVKEQLHIASGKGLSVSQKDVVLDGHSIEVRINAEDPECNFLPHPGKITGLHFPGGFGVRVESAVYPSYTIPPYYDSMIGKIIVHAKNREEAISKMHVALEEFVLEGVPTTAEFAYELLEHSVVRENKHTTHFIAEYLQDKKNKVEDSTRTEK